MCAESITAGLVTSTIASVPGASAILKGGVVTYDQAVKVRLLGVLPATLVAYSAESAETTKEMAEGVQRLFPDCSMYLAVTGVASAPTNDNYEIRRDVGQVYVSVLYNQQHTAGETIIRGADREDIRRLTVEYILKLIIDLID